MDFWRAVDILSKRRWLLLLSVLVTTTLTFGAMLLMGSRWTAAVTFTAPPTSSLTVAPDSPYGAANNGDPRGDRAQIGVYNAMAKSEYVTEPVLQRLQRQFSVDKAELPNNIQVTSNGPRTFDLQVTDSSPQRASILAREVWTSFKELNKAVYTRQARDVVKTLDEQMEKVEKRLNEARQKYDLYRREHRIASTLNDSVNPVLNRLQAARQKKDELTDRIVALEAQITQKQRELASTPATVPFEQAGQITPLARQLETQLAQAEAQLTTLRARYTDQTVEVRQALAVRDALSERLKQEMNNHPESSIRRPNPEVAQTQGAIRRLKQELGSVQAEANSVSGALQRTSAELGSFTGLDGKLAAMVADISNRTEERTNLSQRRMAAQMALDVATGKTDPVTDLGFRAPINEAAGRTPKIVGIAALLALIGTAGLIILLDSIDTRLRTVRDAERVLPAPVVAAIPGPQGGVTSASLCRATEQHPVSLHSEAYRFLALRLMGPRAEHVRSILMLSAKGGQGSTGSAANLGITLAQAGRKVVLIDANVRTPQLHRVFELPNTIGLTSLLEAYDEELLAQALQYTTVPNLQVITSGPSCRNPWELFRSAQLSGLAGVLREKVDYVIWDSASAITFADALNLAPVVDGAFLCVRAMESLGGAEQRLANLLEEMGVPLLGSVVSDLPASVLDAYSSYHRVYQDDAGDLSLVAGRDSEGPDDTSTGAPTGSPKTPPPATSWAEPAHAEGMVVATLPQTSGIILEPNGKNGHVNGKHLNGHVNGKNGHVNGKNGHVNGKLLNGHVDGQVNGKHLNAHSDGANGESESSPAVQHEGDSK